MLGARSFTARTERDRSAAARRVLVPVLMKTKSDAHADEHAAGKKGERVREAIGEMLSSEQRGIEPDREDAPGTLADREPVPTTGDSAAAAAAQKRLAEIERSVGELVNSPELEHEGRARETRSK